MKSLFEMILPFILFGVFITVSVSIIFMLANVIFIGAIIGLVLFVLTVIVDKLTPKRKTNPPSGRVIEHE